MLRIVAILVLLTVVCQLPAYCQRNSLAKEKEVLDSLHKRLTMPLQHFRVSSKVVSMVRCAKGSIIEVDPLSLRRKDDRPLSDSLDLFVSELTKREDFLRNAHLFYVGRAVTRAVVYMQMYDGKDSLFIKSGARGVKWSFFAPEYTSPIVFTRNYKPCCQSTKLPAPATATSIYPTDINDTNRRLLQYTTAIDSFGYITFRGHPWKGDPIIWYLPISFKDSLVCSLVSVWLLSKKGHSLHYERMHTTDKGGLSCILPGKYADTLTVVAIGLHKGRICGFRKDYVLGSKGARVSPEVLVDLKPLPKSKVLDIFKD